MKKLAVSLWVLGLALATPVVSSAASITVSETLEDSLGYDLLTRNLTRTRTTPTSTTTDTPGAENAIGANFGIWSGADVSWRHDFSWLPVGASFISAQIEIRAFGVDGNNDSIRVDNHLIGTLTPEALSGVGLLDFGFSTTTSTSSWLVSGIAANGGVNLLVDPTGGFLNPDNLSVYYSKLSLTYDDSRIAQAAVPEPASMLLLGSGIATVVARRRRQARR